MYIAHHEVKPALEHLDEHLRPLLTLAAHIGLREGKSSASRASTSTSTLGILKVQRFYDPDTTKQKVATELPIPTNCVRTKPPCSVARLASCSSPTPTAA